MNLQRQTNFSVSSVGVPIRNIADYSPFGVQLDGRTMQGDFYRHGFNGMEKDDEVKGGGNSYTTEFRQYDARLGRWLSLDPLMAKFPWQSPYVAFDNNPIYFNDPNGAESKGNGDPPQKNGQESNGQTSSDGNFVFQCGNSENEDKWVKTETYISNFFGTSFYKGPPHYKKEYVQYLIADKNANYLRETFTNLSNQTGIDGYELFTVAMGEGMGFLLDINNFDPNSSIDGFKNLGLDHFGTEVDILIEKGLLESSFNNGDEFTYQAEVNEWGEQVLSATFSNLTNALTAFAAVYSNRRDIMLNSGKSLAYEQPTKEQMTFWTYFYFQGEGRGNRSLESNGSFDFTKMQFNLTGSHPRDVESKSYKRLVTMKYLSIKGQGLIK